MNLTFTRDKPHSERHWGALIVFKNIHWAWLSTVFWSMSLTCYNFHFFHRHPQLSAIENCEHFPLFCVLYGRLPVRSTVSPFNSSYCSLYRVANCLFWLEMTQHIQKYKVWLDMNALLIIFQWCQAGWTSVGD